MIMYKMQVSYNNDRDTVTQNTQSYTHTHIQYQHPSWIISLTMKPWFSLEEYLSHAYYYNPNVGREFCSHFVFVCDNVILANT